MQERLPRENESDESGGGVRACSYFISRTYLYGFSACVGFLQQLQSAVLLYECGAFFFSLWIIPKFTELSYSSCAHSSSTTDDFLAIVLCCCSSEGFAPTLPSYDAFCFSSRACWFCSGRPDVIWWKPDLIVRFFSPSSVRGWEVVFGP